VSTSQDLWNAGVQALIPILPPTAPLHGPVRYPANAGEMAGGISLVGRNTRPVKQDAGLGGGGSKHRSAGEILPGLRPGLEPSGADLVPLFYKALVDRLGMGIARLSRPYRG
jgi:hypothetical protein